MFEAIIFGTAQGITEWLPVSSEGVTVLLQIYILPNEMSFRELVHFALFLHIGTFFAALIYFRKDVLVLLRTLTRFSKADEEELAVLRFLVLSTVISGVIGFAILKIFAGLEEFDSLSARFIAIGVGILLVITALLQLKANRGGNKQEVELTLFDGIFLGVMQGIAIIPGLSRSGLTVSALLLRRFNSVSALRLSFLMSLPAVLGANIIANLRDLYISKELLLAVVVSFVFGVITIHYLMKLAARVNFGYFVLLLGIFMIVMAFIIN